MDSKAALYFKKYVVLFYGVCIQTFGISISYHADIGSGPIAVFHAGIGKVFGVSVGVGSWIFSFVFIALALIFRSKYISVATFIMTFGFGYILDFWNAMLGYVFPEVIDVQMKVICIIATTILTPMGIGIIISANAGAGAGESYLLHLHETTGIPYKYIMLGLNVICGVLGFFMGGVLGPATITMMLLSGYISAKMTTVSSKTIIPLLGIDGLAVE